MMTEEMGEEEEDNIPLPCSTTTMATERTTTPDRIMTMPLRFEVTTIITATTTARMCPRKRCSEHGRTSKTR